MRGLRCIHGDDARPVAPDDGAADRRRISSDRLRNGQLRILATLLEELLLGALADLLVPDSISLGIGLHDIAFSDAANDLSAAISSSS